MRIFSRDLEEQKITNYKSKAVINYFHSVLCSIYKIIYLC